MLNLPLIEIIILHRPFTPLRQRAMEGKFLTETTIADILKDPLRTAFLFRMEPGIGPKSKLQIIAAVHEALDVTLGRDWFESLDSAHSEAAQENSPVHAQLRTFCIHWPYPDRPSPTSAQMPENGISGFSGRGAEMLKLDVWRRDNLFDKHRGATRTHDQYPTSRNRSRSDR